MLTILIVDDEKIERKGICFLLKKQGGEFRILEAQNGSHALTVLAENKVDILFSDVKMPVMNGLELAAKAREKYPDLEIVIFSGYNDFSYAKEALRQGVSDYVLKPVDPEEFAKTFAGVVDKVENRRTKTMQEEKDKEELKKFFLLSYLHTAVETDRESLSRLMGEEETFSFRRMMLLHVQDSLFEAQEESVVTLLQDCLRLPFFYLNLSGGEALLLFKEKYIDYEEAARRLVRVIADRFQVKAYISVSEEADRLEILPEKYRDMEDRMEEKFYERESAVFMPGYTRELTGAPQEDSQILEQIREDVRCKDIPHLRKCFSVLQKKYSDSQRYSQMYVKFVFSTILKEIVEGQDLSAEEELSQKIDALYRAKEIGAVAGIVEKAIDEAQSYYREKSMHFREEITRVKAHIMHHYMDDLSVEDLAGVVYLSPGYLSSIFKEETGVNLNRYIRQVRMEKAKELLETTTMKVTDVARNVGFTNSSYFTKSFREFFGSTPEACRSKRQERR